VSAGSERSCVKTCRLDAIQIGRWHHHHHRITFPAASMRDVRVSVTASIDWDARAGPFFDIEISGHGPVASLGSPARVLRCGVSGKHASACATPTSAYPASAN